MIVSSAQFRLRSAAGGAVGTILKFFASLFLTLCGLVFANATYAQDFTPSFAADQPVLTTRSQEFEVLQFKELARWRSVDDRVSSMIDDVKRALENYERAQKLLAKGAISQVELDNKKFFFEQISAGLYRLKIEQKVAELSADILKLRVLEEGNPTKDYRLKIIEKKLEIMSLEKDSNESSLDAAKRAEYFYEYRLKSGDALLKKNVISQVEYDQRRSQHLDAQNKTKMIMHEIDALNVSTQGLEKSRARLLGNN